MGGREPRGWAGSPGHWTHGLGQTMGLPGTRSADTMRQESAPPPRPARLGCSQGTGGGTDRDGRRNEALCQLNRGLRYLVRHYSEIFWRVLDEINIKTDRLFFLMWVGLVQADEGLKRTKSPRRRECLLPDCLGNGNTSLSPAFKLDLSRRGFLSAEPAASGLELTPRPSWLSSRLPAHLGTAGLCTHVRPVLIKKQN